MNIFEKIITIISVLGVLLPCEGDANLDELVNVQDIVLTISHILEVELLEDENFSNSDANNDELVDVLDVVIIVGIILSNDNECDETYLDLLHLYIVCIGTLLIVLSKINNQNEKVLI